MHRLPTWPTGLCWLKWPKMAILSPKWVKIALNSAKNGPKHVFMTVYDFWDFLILDPKKSKKKTTKLGPRMAIFGPEMAILGQNGSKWPKIGPKIVQNMFLWRFMIFWDFWIFLIFDPKMTPNGRPTGLFGPQRPKMALLTQNGHFGPKWSFWVKMGQNGPKMG